MTTTEATPDIDKNPLLSVRFIISACVVLAILVGGAFLLLNRPEAPTAPAPLTSAGTCDLPASGETVLTDIPESGQVAVGAGRSAVAAPRTEEHGPAIMNDGVPSCWAQSPFGAVSAAAAVAAMGSAGMEHSLYRDLTVEGDERDQLLAENTEDTAPYRDGTEIVGFALLDYTLEDATVSIVASDGELMVAGTYDMVYVDGDWRYDPPLNLEPQFAEIDDMNGYTEFRGGPTDG